MIKKIKVERLKPGFFVHDFNCGWLNHPFFKNRMMLKSDKDIEKIVARGIHEVYIDTDAGLDLDDAPTQEEVDQAIDNELEALTPAIPSKPASVPLAERVDQSKTLIIESKFTTQCLLDGVKFGQPIDTAELASMIDNVTAQVLDDGNALVCLLRNKRRNEYSYLHSLSVAALCISFAQSMSFDAEQVRDLGMGGLLHDIGEVRTPSRILNKPGPLTDDEYGIMQQHVARGIEIVRQTGRLSAASASIIAQHHERLDGTGYPKGLRGDEIGLFGQVAAIADIYDALTSTRCYNVPLPPTGALRKIYEWSDTYLNRYLVEQFIAHIGVYPIGSLVRMRSGEVGVVLRHGEQSLLRPVVRIIFDRFNRRVNDASEVDLSLDAAGSDGYDIVHCESSERLKADPIRFLF
ncbi:MAG: HD-GYP domain-containing protein [Deltaproteobacteria bacterium]|nr:HD-GYP domain-containing protein [Deltaproteobacteria bacterium]